MRARPVHRALQRGRSRGRNTRRHGGEYSRGVGARPIAPGMSCRDCPRNVIRHVVAEGVDGALERVERGARPLRSPGPAPPPNLLGEVGLPMDHGSANGIELASAGGPHPARSSPALSRKRERVYFDRAPDGLSAKADSVKSLPRFQSLRRTHHVHRTLTHDVPAYSAKAEFVSSLQRIHSPRPGPPTGHTPGRLPTLEP
jgi:hypothetical protein